MSAVYHWILNGKGRGKRYLFALAMLFASMSSFVVYFSWNNIAQSPVARTFIMQIPALTLKEGQLIEPVDTYQDIVWTNGGNTEDQYHFVIDTQSSGADMSQMPKNGLYLMKNDVYLLNDGKVTVQPLEKIPDFRLTNTELHDVLQKGSIRFSWLLFFSLTIGLFITFYIWSLLFALASYVLTLAIPSQRYSFPVRRRLSVVCLIVGYVLFIPLTFVGLYLSAFAFVLTVLLLMSFLITYLPKSLSFTVDKP